MSDHFWVLKSHGSYNLGNEIPLKWKELMSPEEHTFQNFSVVTKCYLKFLYDIRMEPNAYK